MQLVCLWLDIDHYKFEPCNVSHRGAVRQTKEILFVKLSDGDDELVSQLRDG